MHRVRPSSPDLHALIHESMDLTTGDLLQKLLPEVVPSFEFWRKRDFKAFVFRVIQVLHLPALQALNKIRSQRWGPEMTINLGQVYGSAGRKMKDLILDLLPKALGQVLSRRL